MRILPIFPRLTMLAAVAALLQACGGGGNSAPTPSQPAPPSFSLDTKAIVRQVDVTAAPTQSAVVAISVSGAPQGFYTQLKNTTSVISSAQVASTGTTTANLLVNFRPPYQLAPAAYTDSIQLSVCLDPQCLQPVAGSPASISVAYSVTRASGAGAPTFTLSQTHFAVTAQFTDVQPPASASVDVSYNFTPPVPVSVYTTNTSRGIAGVNQPAGLKIDFKSPTGMLPGTYTDSVTVDACLDSLCVNRLAGSPQTITTQYTISNTVSGPGGFTIDTIPLKVNDLVWNAQQGRLYLAVASASASNADTVAVLNPMTLAVESSVPSGGIDPRVLALSDDGSYLYVGFNSSNIIARRTPPALAQDLTIPLGADALFGPFNALDIQVAPGQATTIAVARGQASSPASNGAVIFDNAVARPSIAGATGISPFIDVVLWGGSGSTLYGGDTESTGETFTTMLVDSSGAHAQTTANGLVIGRLHGDAGTIYTDRGAIIDPIAGTASAAFAPPPASFGAGLAIDHALNRAYLMTGFSQPAVLWSFNLTTHASIASIPVPGFAFDQSNVNMVRLVRWGTDGLAMASADAKVIIIHGPFVTQ